ncbi:hypothetical protein B0H16DRAFT_1458188 [Mycena metata]|uniref:Uncharacterized protein n=1 Tax=Mycena metata TaxID=1033252 RepID=A0AAD7J3H4_9AGAR|nr:hypothetical protein B0H16DRAFT_1458188 [Mycena metata]
MPHHGTMHLLKGENDVSGQRRLPKDSASARFSGQIVFRFTQSSDSPFNDVLYTNAVPVSPPFTKRTFRELSELSGPPGRMEHILPFRNLKPSRSIGQSNFYCTGIRIRSDGTSSTPLSLDSSGVLTWAVLQTLAVVPTVKKLVISTQPLSEDLEHDPEFISLMLYSRDASGAMLCPNLQRIELLHFYNILDESLLEFIQARTHPEITDVITRLESLCAVIHREMQTDIIPVLESPIAEGLAVSLRSDSRPRYNRYSVSEFLKEAGANPWSPLSESWLHHTRAVAYGSDEPAEKINLAEKPESLELSSCFIGPRGALLWSDADPGSGYLPLIFAPRGDRKYFQPGESTSPHVSKIMFRSIRVLARGPGLVFGRL